MNAYKFNDISDWCMLSIGFLLGTTLMLIIVEENKFFVMPVLIIAGTLAIGLTLAIVSKIDTFEKKLKEFEV